VQAASDAALLVLADAEAFVGAAATVDQSVTCLREAAPTTVLAAAHRVLGLHAFRAGDPERSRAAFRAARRLEPTFTWPDSLLAPDDPARRAYESVNADSATETVPAPAAGRLLFDGVPDTERPTARATVFQRVDDADRYVDAAYLWPGVAPPPYPLPPPPDPGPRKRRTALLIGAGGAALTSAMLYGLAGGAASNYADPATPYADGPGIRGRTNGLVVGSAVTGAAAVGLGVGALLQGRL
jgi:hypothetical protein